MRKKLFAILMSAMMMVTFMPSMAFAVTLNDITGLTVDNIEPSDELVAHTDAEKTTTTLQSAVYCGSGAHVSLTKIDYACGDYKVVVGEEVVGPGKCSPKTIVTETMSTAALKTLINGTVKSEFEKFIRNEVGEASADATNVAFVIDQFAEELAAKLVGATATGTGTSEVAETAKAKQLLKEAIEAALAPAKSVINKIKCGAAVAGEVAELVKNKSVQEVLAAAMYSLGVIAENYVDFVGEGMLADINAQGLLNKDTVEKYYSNRACSWIVKYCTVCGDIKEVRIVEHTFGATADCATQKTCTVCGKTVYNNDKNWEATEKYAGYVKTIVAQAEKIAKKLQKKDANGYWEGPNKMEGLDEFTDDVREIEAALLNLDASAVHEFAEPEVKEVACGKVVSLKCKKCGEKIVMDIPLVNTVKDHNWQEVTYNTSVDCTSGEGKYQITAKKCADCGAFDVTSFRAVKPSKLHNYVTRTVAATCGLPGYAETYCTVCGKTKSIDLKSVTPPTGHKYVSEMLVAPSCTSDGVFKIACETCGKSMLIVGGKVLGSEKSIADGAYKINNLGNLNSLTDVVALVNAGRFVSVGSAKKALYFTGFGVLGFPDLLNENAIKVPSTVAKGKNSKHNFTTWAKVYDPTCNYGEIWARKCSTCGYVDIHSAYNYAGDNGCAVQVGAKAGHKPVTVTVPATCGHFGFTYTECSVCHAVIGLKATTPDMKCKTDDLGNYSKSKTEIALEEEIIEKIDKTTHKSASAYATAIDYSLLNRTAHQFDGAYKVVLEPTFHQVGCEAHTCIYCGAASKINRHEIPKLTLGKAYQPKLTAGKGKITVKITKANKYATGYQIVYKVTGKNNAKYVKVAGKTPSKVIKSLKKGKKYEVKVRPYRVDGGKTFYGKYSTVKYVTVK